MKMSRLEVVAYAVVLAGLLIGSGPAKADNEDANEAYVKLGQLYRATVKTPGFEHKIRSFGEITEGLEKVISDYPESDVAIRIISEEKLFGGFTLSEHLDNQRYRNSDYRDDPEASLKFSLRSWYEKAYSDNDLTENYWNLLVQDAPPLENSNYQEMYWRLKPGVFKCYELGYLPDDALRVLAFIASRGGHLGEWIDGKETRGIERSVTAAVYDSLNYACPIRVGGKFVD